MAKYIKLFNTHAEYQQYMDQNGQLPNVSHCIEQNEVHYNPYVPAPRLDIITYEADAKLTETTSSSSAGLHTNAFNTTIKSHTFENGVGTIEFNDDVTSIGTRAFNKCSGLTSITIPSSVTSIGDYALYDCSGLTGITIPSSVTSIGGSVFYGCSSLTSITIPNGVTTIGDNAFDNCRGLTSVTIPSSVTSIGEYAFSHCRGLTSVTIPSSVTTIGQYAFTGCYGLTSIEIPSSVTSIGDGAFYNCSVLTSVTVNVTTPPTLGVEAFDGNASGRRIYVPSESVSTYKSASGWSDYASDIYAIGS